MLIHIYIYIQDANLHKMLIHMYKMLIHMYKMLVHMYKLLRIIQMLIPTFKISIHCTKTWGPLGGDPMCEQYSYVPRERSLFFNSKRP